MSMRNARATKSENRRSFVTRMYRAALVISLVAGWRGELQAQARNPDGLVDSTQPKLAQAAGPMGASPIIAEDYIIGPDDLLNIYVLDVPELSRDYRVSATGTITVPVLANPLNAAGLTLAQFSTLLSQDLKSQGLVSDPHITMSVDQSSLHSVAITGAVKRPQIYPVLSRTTLLDMLSQAEGLAEDAGGTAIVRRGD